MLVLVTPGGASAKEATLYDNICARGAASLEDALSFRAGDLDCSNHRFATQAPFVRLHAKIPPMGSEPLLLQTDAALFDRMFLEFTYADGSVRQATVLPEDVSANWFADTRFSVSVPHAPRPLEKVDVVVVRPWSNATLTDLRIIDESEAMSEQYAHALIHVLIAGLLAAALFFDLFFFRLLRARFIVWHACLTFSLLVFVLSNSGLIYEVVPGLALKWRYFLNTFSLAACSLFGLFFLLSILEKRLIPGWVRTGAAMAAGFMLVIKVASLIDAEPIRQIAHAATMMALISVCVMCCIIIFYAILRQSRLWPYVAVAWGAMIAAGMVRMAAELGYARRSYIVDDALLVSTAILALGSAAAVASKMMNLRIERDRARSQAIQLGKMAMTDPLTGLGNRRAFERMKVLAPGQGMLLIDIDLFKAINDTFGHAMGDRVLAFAAQAMRSCFREGEHDAQAFRIGGEEFVIVLRCSDEAQLQAAGERLRGRIEQGPNEGRDELPNVTISIGAVMGEGQSRQAALEHADEALYTAKRAGRNAVCMAVAGKGASTVFGPPPLGAGQVRPH